MKTSMNPNPLVLPVLVISLAFASAACAAILEVDLSVPGDKLLTRDTGQGLDFLDLTEAAARSYNDVSSHFGAGGDFEGFRYATMAEIDTLWTNAGIDLRGESPTAPDITEIVALMGILGINSGSDATHGMYDELPTTGFVSHAILQARFDHPIVGQWTQAGFNVDNPNYDIDTPFLGSYLVKDSAAAVPEPGVWLVVGVGLVTCCLWRRQ
jgi:hypothetical protein